ncbi:MAG TPA: helical backbone metal receptor [Vicinamibacterales bacterium]|nr:helical backbone metal receptor [Vicinamibacterales bacterium]
MAAGSKRLIAVAFVLVVCWATRPAAMQQRTTSAVRIVSLVPALTEMLFAIGAGPQVIAISSYDEFPPEVTSLPRVGALLDPDMERILALRPDLVVSYGSQTDVQAQLARAKIRVFSYKHAGLAGVFTTLKDLGAAVGRPAESDNLARQIRTGLDAIQARVRGRPQPRTLLVFERDPASLRGVYVSGGVGFLHDMLGIAGGVNVFADVARESVQPSIETMLARAPEVILEVRATGLLAATDIAQARRVWGALGAVPAVKQGRIEILTGEHLVVPGPRVVQATAAFARALHPDVYK